MGEEGGVSGEAGDDRGPVTAAGGESRRSRPIFEPATGDSYNFRFSAGKEFVEKFERLAEVIGVGCAHNHVEEVLDVALEIALEKTSLPFGMETSR